MQGKTGILALTILLGNLPCFAASVDCQPKLTFEGVGTPRSEGANSAKAAASKARLEAYRLLAIAVSQSKQCIDGRSQTDATQARAFVGNLPMIYQPTRDEFDGEKHVYTLQLSVHDWAALMQSTPSFNSVD